MREYVYPAVFHPNDDGSFLVAFPDLPGCITEGNSLAKALYMAQDALKQWIEAGRELGQLLPEPTLDGSIRAADREFVNLILYRTK